MGRSSNRPHLAPLTSEIRPARAITIPGPAPCKSRCRRTALAARPPHQPRTAVDLIGVQGRIGAENGRLVSNLGCRAGSLEKPASKANAGLTIYCRTGSFENQAAGSGDRRNIHCRTGSLEKYRLAQGPPHRIHCRTGSLGDTVWPKLRIRSFLREPTGDVFVEHTGNEGLIGHPFLHCFDLNVSKIAR